MQTDSAAALGALGSRIRRLPWQFLVQPVARAAAAVMSLPVWVILGVVVLLQWLVVGTVAAITPHNGWAYYSGGDDSWYYTSGWVLGHGHVPQSAVGYGYSILIAPLARIAGPNLVAGLPLVLTLNVFVLWPVGLLCVYGIAKAIGGRGFAYLALLAWTAFPLAVIPYFDPRYHVRYIDQNLPSALGLVSTGDFASMVFLLVAGYFALRAVTQLSPEAALFAGAAAGFAATIKPSNLIFLPAPLAALAFARRPRELLLLCGGLVPALLGLALWKYRGLGYVPAFSSPTAAIAGGSSFTPPALESIHVRRYLPLDWGHLWKNMDDIREYTWSLRLVTWALVAGVIALARRSGTVAILIGGWLFSYIALKGSAPGVNVTDGSFFRYMTPAFPAFFFGLVSLPLLVPGFGRRLAARGRAERYWPTARRSWKILAGVAGVAIAAPILAIAASSPLVAPAATKVPSLDQYVPANTFTLTARKKSDGSVVLRWPSQNGGSARVGYAVFRENEDNLVCPLLPHAAAACVFYSDPFNHLLSPTGRSKSTTFRDRPPLGHWVYRVAATVSPYGPTNGGNFMAFSRPATVDVAR
jgi:hypothetical protein